MIRVLMCGPIALSGGGSTHTKNISKCLSKLGVKIVLFNLSGKDIKSLESPPLRRLYQKTLGLTFEAIKRRNEYDIIHIQASGGIFSFISAITGALVSKICNKMLIVTFHYSQTEKFVRNYKKLFGFVLKHVKKLILVSNKQKEIISSLFSQFSDKIIVIPNGYVSDLFYPKVTEECRKDLNLPIGKKIIFNISNLIETKGHKYLIEAVEEIVKHRKDVFCFIAGKGYLKNELENKIISSGLEGHVKLVGWILDEEIPIWMNTADLFVLPSLAESFGIVQIEAMACGKPVVATYNGGSEEIITSEDYGLLVEPANPKVLAEKILIALDKKWDHERILRYVERFRWENITGETLEVYKNIIGVAKK